MFREVLRKVCETELGHRVVGEASDGRSAVALAANTKPELVLLDLHLPRLDGFAVLREIRKVEPAVRALVLSSHCDEYTVLEAERARVQGFVDKNTNTVATLKQAITAVAQGRGWFSEAFQAVKQARLGDPNSFDKLLTAREQQVVSLVGLPLEDEQIAARLGISVPTVAKHRFNALRKLGLRTRTDLARYAREHGLTGALPAPDGDESVR